MAEQSGCIASDWPTALILMDVLSRNIQRGCRFEVDVGGWSFHLGSSALRRTPRAENQGWQRFVLDYFRSGDVALVIRFTRSRGFSPASAQTYRSWPRVHRVGKYELRQPQPQSSE